MSARTPKSLGYVTLPLKPTPGKTVRIALVGAIDDKDGFGMVEVTGKKLDDTKGGGGKGNLEIVEVEIYEPFTHRNANPARHLKTDRPCLPLQPSAILESRHRLESETGRNVLIPVIA